MFLLFIFEFSWLYRLATFICFADPAEEIAITSYLSKLRSKYPSKINLTILHRIFFILSTE